MKRHREPPLHNIPPPRTPLGDELRQWLREERERLVPPVLMHSDYSTVELRIMAQLEAQGLKFRPR